MGHELGIIGAGNMAEAIARSVIAANVIRKEQIIAADVSEARRDVFSKMGVKAVNQNADAVNGAKLLLLSVKPQQMKDVLAGIASKIGDDTIIISIGAGISSAFIEKSLGGAKPWHIIRVMPNTPMMVGQGMVAIARGRNASDEDLKKARRIFEAGATILELAEAKMDAVTAMSGSGPAYFFWLVEQMIKAGVTLGLSEEESRTMAVKTCIGSAAMLGSGERPEDLRRKVTSPGGTTQAAMETLEGRQAGDAVVQAIRRAAERSRELGA